jgi:hypothetical protein
VDPVDPEGLKQVEQIRLNAGGLLLPSFPLLGRQFEIASSAIMRPQI